MLSSEFNAELGSLIRSLEQKVRDEPTVRGDGHYRTPLDHLDRAIISLIAQRIALSRRDA